MAARIDVNAPKGSVYAAVARAAVLAGIVMAVATCSYGERTYSADAIDSRVVDADTGQPIAGVNVVAEWVLKGGVESGEVTGYANVMETVTDTDGRFHFPAWGPLTVKRGSVREAGPALLLFKPGYHYAAYANASSAEAPPHLTSRWSGKDLSMTNRHGSLDKVREELAAYEVAATLVVEHGHIDRISSFACGLALEGARLKTQVSTLAGITAESLRTRGIACPEQK